MAAQAAGNSLASRGAAPACRDGFGSKRKEQKENIAERRASAVPQPEGLSENVKTLKAECKARGLKRYSKLRKADLYDLLRNNGGI